MTCQNLNRKAKQLASFFPHRHTLSLSVVCGLTEPNDDDVLLVLNLINRLQKKNN